VCRQSQPDSPRRGCADNWSWLLPYSIEIVTRSANATRYRMNEEADLKGCRIYPD
jgi:hypothetical protein